MTLLTALFTLLFVAPELEIKADASRVRAHMEFLADDLLEGREAGTPGHEIAARYVASQFKQIGLTPAGTEGFFQAVPLRQAMLVQSSPSMILRPGNDSWELDFLKDFLVRPSRVRTESEVRGELVFVGYGIDSPELGVEDYAGVDVRGRVVVVFRGAPEGLPSEERAAVSNGRAKTKAAARRGAIGMIGVPTPVSEGVFPFARMRLYVAQSSMSWLHEDGSVHAGFPELKAGAVLSMDAAKKLFERAASVSYEDALAMADAGQVRDVFSNAEVAIAYQSEHVDIRSPNVLAVLPGQDPELEDEYLVLTAHLDHIGLAKTVTGDDVNNGAMDNASGTATMIETARLLAERGTRRSVLFASVTAEEKGLLGAEYFVYQPTIPKESIVANVNLDMPLLTFPLRDVIAFGAKHSSLEKAVRKAAAEMGVMLVADPWPEQAIFTRSDHYRFVEQGIPAVALTPGFEAGSKSDAEKAWMTCRTEHYHLPSDDMTQPIDFGAAAAFAELNARIAKRVADGERRPRWWANSFFAPVSETDSEAHGH